MSKTAFKIFLLVWSAALVWVGFSLVGGAWASFVDSEKSENNSFTAGKLDFKLTPVGFTKEPIPAGEVLARNVNVLDGGTAFRYEVASAGLSGPLCDYVELEAGPRSEDAEYAGPLGGFQYGPVDSSDIDKWSFGISFRPDVPENLRDETCRFKIVFSGSQMENDLPFGEGFTDEEEITDEVSFKRNGIVLNEFLPNPEGDDNGGQPAGEWVELYNRGKEDVDVDGWVLYDSDDDHELVISPDNIDADSTVIKPKKFLVVYRDGDADFALNNSGGDTVRLYAGEISAGAGLVDAYGYEGRASEGKSFARIPDGADNWVDPVPTPGKKNKLEEEKSGSDQASLEKEEDSGKADVIVPEQNPNQVDPLAVADAVIPAGDDGENDISGEREDGTVPLETDAARSEIEPEEIVEDGGIESGSVLEPDDPASSASG